MVWAGPGEVEGQSSSRKRWAEMINNVILVDFGTNCLSCVGKREWCQAFGSKVFVIPVPKKRGQGLCVTDDFCGISVVSVHVPYKTMCMIVKE